MAKNHFSIKIPKTNHELQFTSELLVIFMVFATSVLLFAFLADGVLDKDTQSVDVAILRGINSYSTPLLDRLVPLLTNTGGLIGGAVLAAVATTVLYVMQQKRKALVIVFSSAGALLLNLLLKAIFIRPRPEEWTRIVEETNYSFPSGHAMSSAALAFALIAVTWRTRWRWPVVVLTVLYTVMIGITRLYLGVHYPTDIIGGWFVSAAWVSIVVLMLYGRLAKHTKLTD